MKGKIFLGLLVLVLAVLTIPSLRQRAQPQLDRMGEKLEGPLSPVLTPYRQLRTEGEIGKIVRELVRDRNMGVLRPMPDEFGDYIRLQLEDEDGLDAWGSPYIMLPEPDSMAIVSAGPDLDYQTEDDVTVKIRYRERPSRFRR